MLLGSSPGGGILYIEPPSVVGLNNELNNVRAEAFNAEDAVLWRLTGHLMGSLSEVQAMFEVSDFISAHVCVS